MCPWTYRAFQSRLLQLEQAAACPLEIRRSCCFVLKQKDFPVFDFQNHPIAGNFLLRIPFGLLLPHRLGRNLCYGILVCSLDKLQFLEIDSRHFVPFALKYALPNSSEVSQCAADWPSARRNVSHLHCNSSSVPSQMFYQEVQFVRCRWENRNNIYMIGSCFGCHLDAPCVAVVSIEDQQYWITGCEFHTVVIGVY